MPCPILCAAKVTLFNCALGHSQKSINRYTAKAKLCFCKNNKRRIIKPHAGSQDNGNGKLLLRSPTATRPPSFGIRAESGVPLGDFQLLGPAVPASPKVCHPYPAPCHGAAHQELGALQGLASALRRHALRGTPPASPPSEAQGHSRGLHPARGGERVRGASRQRKGPRALVEAPLMAQHHQAHILQLCLRPINLGDFCIHNVRFGGPHPCSPPQPP